MLFLRSRQRILENQEERGAAEVEEEDEEEEEGGERKSTVGLSRVIEHNRKAGARSAGGTLAAPAPPILQ